MTVRLPEHRAVCLMLKEADRLAQDEVLCDPTDRDILIACAEMVEAEHGCEIDLDEISIRDRNLIIQHYDNRDAHYDIERRLAEEAA